MTYIIKETYDHIFMVYRSTDWSFTCVKTFKTRKGAENWVKKHS